MSGISNFTINKLINEIDDALKQNFVGVFPFVDKGFSKVHNKNSVDVYMVDDQLQNIKSDTCGLFQLYFSMNLFLPREGSQIVSNRSLTLKTIQNLLNEIFSKDISKNEEIVEHFALEHDIKREK